MSEGQVDLDALIKSDKKKKHIHKEKRREQSRRHRRDRKQRRHRDRSPYKDRRRSPPRSGHPKKQKAPREVFVQNYALHVTGFVADISLQDILKLAKGKKIINIKATLAREDHQPLDVQKDTNMSVIINFSDKQQANQFIKEYADKKLDGKNTLQFQFRRGFVSRKKATNQNNEEQADKKVDENEQQASQQ